MAQHSRPPTSKSGYLGQEGSDALHKGTVGSTIVAQHLTYISLKHLDPWPMEGPSIFKHEVSCWRRGWTPGAKRF